MAERVGFEPTVALKLHWISRPAPSTTRTPLQKGITKTLYMIISGFQVNIELDCLFCFLFSRKNRKKSRSNALQVSCKTPSITAV
jgi:hypothetical protein